MRNSYRRFNEACRSGNESRALSYYRRIKNNFIFDEIHAHIANASTNGGGKTIKNLPNIPFGRRSMKLRHRITNQFPFKVNKKRHMNFILKKWSFRSLNEYNLALIIHTICENGLLDLFIEIVNDFPFECSFENASHNNIIHSICLCGNEMTSIEMVNVLIDRKRIKNHNIISSKNGDGNTPIHLACQLQYFQLVRQLIALNENCLYVRNDVNLLPIDYLNERTSSEFYIYLQSIMLFPATTMFSMDEHLFDFSSSTYYTCRYCSLPHLNPNQMSTMMKEKHSVDETMVKEIIDNLRSILKLINGDDNSLMTTSKQLRHSIFFKFRPQTFKHDRSLNVGVKSLDFRLCQSVFNISSLSSSTPSTSLSASGESKEVVNNLRTMSYKQQKMNMNSVDQFSSLPDVRLMETSDERKYDCPICFRRTSATYRKEECHHRCCLDCWKRYLTEKIISTEIFIGNSNYNLLRNFKIDCPFYDCNKMLKKNEIEKLLPDKRYLVKKLFIQVDNQCRKCGNDLLKNSLDVNKEKTENDFVEKERMSECERRMKESYQRRHSRGSGKMEENSSNLSTTKFSVVDTTSKGKTVTTTNSSSESSVCMDLNEMRRLNYPSLFGKNSRLLKKWLNMIKPETIHHTDDSTKSLKNMDRLGTAEHCSNYHYQCRYCSLNEQHGPLTCEESIGWYSIYHSRIDQFKIEDKCTNAPYEKFESDLTELWILKNSKRCPNCHVAIEKNDGCNHMKCMRCFHQFCWVCLDDWKGHGANTGGYYQCNRTDKITSQLYSRRKFLHRFNKKNDSSFMNLLLLSFSRRYEYYEKNENMLKETIKNSRYHIIQLFLATMLRRDIRIRKSLKTSLNVRRTNSFRITRRRQFSLSPSSTIIRRKRMARTQSPIGIGRSCSLKLLKNDRLHRNMNGMDDMMNLSEYYKKLLTFLQTNLIQRQVYEERTNSAIVNAQLVEQCPIIGWMETMFKEMKKSSSLLKWSNAFAYFRWRNFSANFNKSLTTELFQSSILYHLKHELIAFDKKFRQLEYIYHHLFQILYYNSYNLKLRNLLELITTLHSARVHLLKFLVCSLHNDFLHPYCQNQSIANSTRYRLQLIQKNTHSSSKHLVKYNMNEMELSVRFPLNILHLIDGKQSTIICNDINKLRTFTINFLTVDRSAKKNICDLPWIIDKNGCHISLLSIINKIPIVQQYIDHMMKLQSFLVTSTAASTTTSQYERKEKDMELEDEQYKDEKFFRRCLNFKFCSRYIKLKLGNGTYIPWCTLYCLQRYFYLMKKTTVVKNREMKVDKLTKLYNYVQLSTCMNKEERRKLLHMIEQIILTK